MESKPTLETVKRCSSIVVSNNINNCNSGQPGPYSNINPKDIKNLFSNKLHKKKGSSSY